MNEIVQSGTEGPDWWPCVRAAASRRCLSACRSIPGLSWVAENNQSPLNFLLEQKTHSGHSQRQRKSLPFNSGNKCPSLTVLRAIAYFKSSHDCGAELPSVSSPSFCDSQRHSAALASLNKKTLVHLIESHQVRLNLFPLKITIYQDNLPSLPQTHTHTTAHTPPHLLPNVNWTERRMWW